jgi:hypothetical protein
MDLEIDKGGRPAIFNEPDALINKVNEYFIWVAGEKQIIINAKGEPEEQWKRLPCHTTVTGLALFLGFESRQSIYDYEKDGVFSYIIKNARLRVEEQYEQRLHSSTPTGAIFALKNMGWKDKVETGFTDNEGKDMVPVQIIQLPSNGREKLIQNDNNDTDESAE